VDGNTRVRECARISANGNTRVRRLR
jgi:hypothetical protein